MVRKSSRPTNSFLFSGAYKPLSNLIKIVTIATVCSFVPILSCACALDRFAHGLRLRVNVAPGGRKISMACQVPESVRSIKADQPFRQVCRSVYNVNASTSAKRHAFACCFFSVDFSIWPIQVCAGKPRALSGPCVLQASPRFCRSVGRFGASVSGFDLVPDLVGCGQIRLLLVNRKTRSRCFSPRNISTLGSTLSTTFHSIASFKVRRSISS